MFFFSSYLKLSHNQCTIKNRYQWIWRHIKHIRKPCLVIIDCKIVHLFHLHYFDRMFCFLCAWQRNIPFYFIFFSVLTGWLIRLCCRWRHAPGRSSLATCKPTTTEEEFSLSWLNIVRCASICRCDSKTSCSKQGDRRTISNLLCAKTFGINHSLGRICSIRTSFQVRITIFTCVCAYISLAELLIYVINEIADIDHCQN